MRMPMRKTTKSPSIVVRTPRIRGRPATSRMLSTALFTRLSTTCSSCAVLPCTIGRAGSNAIWVRMSYLPMAADNICRASPTIALRDLSTCSLEEFDVIAAVIIGGASLFGGRGTLFGTLLGAAFITVLAKGQTLIGVPANYQSFTRGIVILIAVTLDMLSQRSIVAPRRLR